MVFSSTLAFGLTAMGMALASPAIAPISFISPRQDPSYPPTVQSRGFTFIANATLPSHPLAPAVHLSTLVSIHLGAGLGGAGLMLPTEPSNARIFYTNGTVDEVANRESTLISDSGSPVFPSGFTIASTPATLPDGQTFDVRLNAGMGSKGVGVTSTPYKYVDTTLGAGFFVACNTTLSYYGPNRYFIVVRWFSNDDNDNDSGDDEDESEDDNDSDSDSDYDDVPAECMPIRLLPQKALLDDELPSGSLSNHDFVQETSVYDDVAAIDWSKFDGL